MNIYSFYKKHGDKGVKILNAFRSAMFPNYSVDVEGYNFIFNEFFVIGLSIDKKAPDGWMLIDDLKNVQQCCAYIQDMGGYDFVVGKYKNAIDRDPSGIDVLKEVKDALDIAGEVISINE